MAAGVLWVRGVRELAIVTLLAVGAFGLGVLTAQAFPQDGSKNCPPDDYIKYKLQSFTAAEKSMVNTYGASDWERYRDLYGNLLVTNLENSSSYQLVVKWDSGTSGGVALCGGVPAVAHTIKLSTSFQEGEDKFNDLDTLSAHEFGHAHGLGHSGKRESAYDDPTMMACFLQTGLALPSNDDFAGLYELHNTEFSGKRTLTANPSFENMSTTFWGTNGALTVLSSGGGSEGSYYVRLTGYGKSASTTVRWSDGHSFSANLDARANFRRDANNSGTIKISLRTSQNPITYGPRPAGNDCDWPRIPDDDNADAPSSVGVSALSTRKVIYCNVSTSWRYCTTGNWYMPTSWVSADARVAVYNYINGTERLYFDNTRARGI